MEISTSDMLQAGANYSAAMAENRENKLAREREVLLSVWEWQKYFEAASTVLTTRYESKENITFSSSIETNDEVKELSKQILAQLLRLAAKNLEQVTFINS
jgi:hypothetical protein